MSVECPSGSFALRPITTADLPFLERLYGCVRDAELMRTAWNTEQKTAFIKMQFNLQHQYYQTHFPTAKFDIIRASGMDIGRRYIAWSEEALTIIDLALLPDWRGRGIGTGILTRLLAEAAAAEKPVLLHVEHDNPAGRLYARLGFVEIGASDVYRELCWRQAGPTGELQAKEIP